MVEVFVFLEIADVLCHQHDVDHLDDLAGLDADAEEADPALVAGAVVVPEGDQRQQQQHGHRHQNRPLVGNQIHVQHGQQDKKRDADEQRHRLHQNIAGASGLAGGCGAGDHDDAEDRADKAQRKQHHVRARYKFFEKGQNLLHRPRHLLDSHAS